MPASEAQIRANQANALRSTGPKTLEGKERSRRNGLKHGMSGAGVVLPEADGAEVERRAEVLLAEMGPKSAMGAMLVREIATLSVRMERSTLQESAAVAAHVRHAPEAFDDERFERAEALFDALGDDPRGNLRKLRRMPEGVDRLVVAWDELRADLHRSPEGAWTAEQRELAANLTGRRVGDLGGNRLEVLSDAIRGDFRALADHEGGSLDEAGRRAWALARMVERIDAEVAALEIHRESLDREAIEQDRLEAPARALFDPSKEATLARRYESEARRGFFRAIKEFRRVEAEFAERPEPVPAPVPVAAPVPPDPVRPVGRLASSRDLAAPSFRDPQPAHREPALIDDGALRRPDGRLLTVGRAG